MEAENVVLINKVMLEKELLNLHVPVNSPQFSDPLGNAINDRINQALEMYTYNLALALSSAIDRSSIDSDEFRIVKIK